jgi:hypothetical protein
MGGLVQICRQRHRRARRRAFEFIGSSLRGMVHAADMALPGGMLFVVAFILVAVVGWNLAKR